MNWMIKTGNFLFKFRSFTPIPLIVLVFILFKPIDMGEKNNLWPALGGLILSVLGEIIRILAVGFSFQGTSGRENYLRADNLNTTGIYSVVRNPLYIGNYFIFAGLVIVFFNPAAFLLFSFFLIVQYYFIILAEEHFLKQTYPEKYPFYLERVSRIIPHFNSYIKNRNPFDSRKVLFKENDSVFNMLMVFIFVLAYKERLLNGKIENPLYYIIAGVGLIIVYIIVKVFKKFSIKL